MSHYNLNNLHRFKRKQNKQKIKMEKHENSLSILWPLLRNLF